MATGDLPLAVALAGVAAPSVVSSAILFTDAAARVFGGAVEDPLSSYTVTRLLTAVTYVGTLPLKLMDKVGARVCHVRPRASVRTANMLSQLVTLKFTLTLTLPLQVLTEALRLFVRFITSVFGSVTVCTNLTQPNLTHNVYLT